jgi:hypothetical protein
MVKEGKEFRLVDKKTGEVYHSANTLGELQTAAANKHTFVAPDDVAGHFADVAKARQGFNAQAPEKIAATRTGVVADDGVVTKLVVDGKEYYGRNTWAGTDRDVAKLFKDSGFVKPTDPSKIASGVTTAHHAEGHVFYQAFAGNGKQRMSGGRATLFVDQEFCGACGKLGGVKSLMRALGVNELQTYRQVGPNGVIVSEVLRV